MKREEERTVKIERLEEDIVYIRLSDGEVLVRKDLEATVDLGAGGEIIGIEIAGIVPEKLVSNRK